MQNSAQASYYLQRPKLPQHRNYFRVRKLRSKGAVPRRFPLGLETVASEVKSAR